MAKLLIILLIGLVFESVGIVLLKKGIMQIGDVKQVSVPEIVRIIKLGAINPQILLGVFFEALFFIWGRKKLRSSFICDNPLQ